MKVGDKFYTIHAKEVKLNKNKLKAILDAKGMEYTELHLKAHKKYGLDITYRAFMNQLSNRSTWKLTYAWIICEIINKDITDVFELVDVDVDKTKQEKKKWEEKYYKD